MNKLTSSSHELILKVETHDLSPMQIRLLKHAHTLLIHVLAADTEEEYFEASSQLLKQAAQVVKHANFAESNKGKIAYGDQAVEYSVDSLNEAMDSGLFNHDN
jgi:hypothetical protein